MNKMRRQFGAWDSPISAAQLAGQLALADAQWDSGGESLLWLERQGKHGSLVVQTGLQAARNLTGDLNVRARVGYGGGDFTVANGAIFFAGPDGRLYRQALAGGPARALTPGYGAAAAPRVSPDGAWLVFVHSYEGVDGLAVVDTAGAHWPRKLIFGTDFVMQPVWHPDGKYMAYIAWNHPQMPWDGTVLRLLSLWRGDDNFPVVENVEVVAGDETTAIFQPEFSADGRYLTYISDATGWGQLWLYDLDEKTHTQLTAIEAEHGAPAWVQGLRMYGWSADSSAIYYLRNQGGFYSLWVYDAAAGRRHGWSADRARRISALDQYTHMSQIAVSADHGGIAMLASSATTPTRVISYYPETKTDAPPQISLEAGARPSIQVLVEEPGGVFVHRRSSGEIVPEAQLAKPEAISWRGEDGEDVHGLYYAPTNEQFEGVGAPPLMVLVHGGPTSQRTASYDGQAQFFATRGFAVLQVNHRGGTGYGKAYMNKLRGNWGICDVVDAASGASYLAEQGLADKAKFVIMGGSAGGYTVLQSLVDRPGFYAAGVCLYGISNQFLLAQDTHKFEKRYTDSLLGPLPEAADVYRERSPIFHAEKISDPVIIFQGEEDVVVPKNQSDLIVAALRGRGVAHEYHVFEGEGHGFRKAETIVALYERTMAFLMQHVIYA